MCPERKAGFCKFGTKGPKGLSMQQFWVCLVLAFLLPGSGRGLDNGLARTPPMGWNSWNHFDCLIDERTVRETADALVRSGLADLGYVYLNIDDCWAEMERDSKGSLQARAATFPSGIKALADYAHQRGLKLGIYSDAGFHTCGGQPGSLGFEHQDAGSFAAWGVDYLKYDNCHTDGRRPEERYPVMQAALNKTGRPILFSLCEWGVDDPATWAAQVGNTWRTTPDIKDRWDRVVAIADENNRWAESAGPGGWNDPDMLEVGNGGMSAEEYRAHFSLWALMKAPLLVGADVRNLSREYLDILGNKEVIGVNQDPLGVQGKKVVSSDAGMEVWAGLLAQGKWAVLLWNRSPQPALMSVDWKEIPGLNNTSKIAPPAVRDLWKHEDLGQLTRIQATVPSHGVKMYTVTSSRSI